MIHQYHSKENKALKTIIWYYGIGSQEREKEKQKGYRGSATYLHTPCTRIKGIGVLVPKWKFYVYRYIYIHRKTKYKDISRAKEDINAYEAIYDTRIYR